MLFRGPLSTTKDMQLLHLSTSLRVGVITVLHYVSPSSSRIFQIVAAVLFWKAALNVQDFHHSSCKRKLG